MNNATEPVELVRRIIAGDSQAEEQMVLRYQAGVFQIIYNIVHNWSVAEDLSQEALLKALEKVRRGEVRDPARLSGFICAIARFMAIEHMRKVRAAATTEGIDMAQLIADPAPDPALQLLDKEKCETVREVINEMKVERDREVLFRYYILEEEKETICIALGLTKEQFSSIIFRAHQRYKVHFEKHSYKN